MQLAVIADIHGNLTALDAALTDLKSVGDIDALWCLGDLAAFGPRPAECVQRVRALIDDYGKDKVKVIGGNTDRYLVNGDRPKGRPVRLKAERSDPDKDPDDLSDAEKAAELSKRTRSLITRDTVLNWNLSQLSADDYAFMAKIIGREARTNVDGYGGVIGLHAIPGDDDAPNLRPDAPEEEARDALLDRSGRLALVGHTHVQFNRDLGRWRVINPGSIGLSFTDAGHAQWALLTFDSGSLSVELRSVPYDLDAAVQDVEASDHPAPGWFVDRLRQAK